MSRPRLLASFLLLIAALPVSSDTPADIDRAVAELAAFIRRTLPDREAQSLAVLPFLAEGGGRLLLGERLAADLELALANSYSRTLIGQPASSAGVRAFAVEGDLQLYPNQIRILCRLRAPDGSLAGGVRVELAMSAGLAALLAPVPSDEEYTGMGLHGLGPESSLERDLDPLEPDDSPGSEVAVSFEEAGAFERYLGPADLDRFRFYLDRPGTTVVEVSTELDAQLLLYREGERVPFIVRGNPDLRSIRLETSLGKGYYIAELMAFDPDAEGAYTARFGLAATADSFEPDDVPGEAKPLAAGSRQERTLEKGNQDWVELRPDRPGFYALYTSGLAVDTALAVFREGKTQILADEDAGAQANAHVGLFLGPGRFLARITGKPPLASGPYTLAFERLSPAQVYPGGGVKEYSLQDSPLFLQLRILQAGRYVIRKQGLKAPLEAELYSLPEMKSQLVAGLISLASGDYLLVLKGAEAQTGRLCVAAEAEAQACIRSVQE